MLPRFSCSLLLLLVVLPGLAADKGNKKKNKRDKNVTAATAADYDALARNRVIVGTLTNVEANGQGLTFQYEYQYLGPNNKNGKARIDNLARQLQNLAVQQEQILLIADPAKRIQRLQKWAAQVEKVKARLGAAQANAYKAATARKEFDLQAIDAVKVRLMHLPVEYDDTGHPKKYSAKELKALRGKDHLPGYQGEWGNLAPGQTVKIYVLPPKKKPADKGKDKVKVENKDAFDLLEEPRKPLVKMIVVLADADTATPSKRKGGR
jgi:hypothetical protein